jgi:magnesium chelatase family protein
MGMEKNLSRTFSAELEGIYANLIEVEVDLNVGLHAFNIVGLADKAIGEAKERVNSALKNVGVKPPNRENRRITVNLAPADVKKTGSQYDVAMAVGYLAATGQIKKFNAQDKLFLGELALDGRLRPIVGALSIAEMAAAKNLKYIYLPEENAEEASVIVNIKIIPIRTLKELIDDLEGRSRRMAHAFNPQRIVTLNSAPDLSEIRGQASAKRALIIAAAGGHNLCMTGPPGVGKSMMAQALTGILPQLTLTESIEVTKIWSAVGLTRQGLITERPFRTPHQTATQVALVGGGSDPRPGEISLAHNGILFLDELPEFQKNVLEALRAPLENGVVHIARARGTLKFPARFTLIAAMNPCPCGYFGDTEKECDCGAYDVLRYQRKISGPLMDRIDLQIRVSRISFDTLRDKGTHPPESPRIRKLVENARAIQAERFKNNPKKIILNSAMNSRETEHHANLEPAAEKLLETMNNKLLSPRNYYRLLKTARTIADLENKNCTSAAHLAEAFSYRLREEI